MKLATFNPSPTMEEALEAVELLRKAVESGRVGAFFAVGICTDDTIVGFTGCSRPYTRLRMLGAIAQAQHDWLAGEVGT